MSTAVFGIRHHGPGSARHLMESLEALRPDVVLIEGPPDANDLIELAADPEMRPPVALLLYDPAAPARAAYYPFAEFSPEWQAIRYALRAGVPVRFIDLPQWAQLGREEEEEEGAPERGAGGVREDPLRWLAEAAGMGDGERWWERMVEHRRSAAGIFEAVGHAMEALRGELALPEGLRERRREAHMRTEIRRARAEGFQNLAVVCGAWHAPALVREEGEREDRALLKKLPRTAVQATWVPWSYGRLASQSGYGAGVHSPGWYHYLWERAGASPRDVAIGWLGQVARLLREEDLSASPAQVVDAARLAEALSALRGIAVPGLEELSEAASSVLAAGNSQVGGLAPELRLIQQRLLLAERLGSVPERTPQVPLQADLARAQKRLRLAPEALERLLELDLRRALDRERSALLHRLSLLGLPWGRLERVGGQKQGTFHENWRLRWEVEFAVRLVEASAWGNTVEEATETRVRARAREAEGIVPLVEMLEGVLLAELPGAARFLIERIENESAVTSDLTHLMRALPPLVQVVRYGSVRGAASETLREVVEHMVARISAGLVMASVQLDEEAARGMLPLLVGVHQAIGLLRGEGQAEDWVRALQGLAESPSVHALLSGRAVRYLLDLERLAPEEAARRMGLVLSPAGEPAEGAAWAQGFLSGSAVVLLHDARLWGVLDRWVEELEGEVFQALLPLLRRTFSDFQLGERRALGELARRGVAPAATRAAGAEGLVAERAERVLPRLAELLGTNLAA